MTDKFFKNYSKLFESVSHSLFEECGCQKCSCPSNHHHSEHGDVEMAKKQLHTIAKLSAKIHNMLSNGDCALESWQESLIAQASDDIEAVYHSSDYDVVSELSENETKDEKWTLTQQLYSAVKSGDRDTVSKLLGDGADPNDDDGFSLKLAKKLHKEHLDDGSRIMPKAYKDIINMLKKHMDYSVDESKINGYYKRKGKVAENMDSELAPSDVKELIRDEWNNVFPDSRINVSIGRFNDNYILAQGTLGAGKEEYKNNIRHNDPLNLMISVDLDEEVEIGVEKAFLAVSPDNPMMAFSNKKIGLRGSKPKNEQQLRKKLGDMFKKVKTVTKQELEAGNLDVHGEEIVNMIKGKLKEKVK